MEIKKNDISLWLAGIQILLLVILIWQVQGLNKRFDQVGAAPSDSVGAGDSEDSAPTVDAKSLVDDDPYLGDKNAKVVVVEFSDYQCPYCGAAAGTHEALVQRFKSQDPTWEAAEPKLQELAKAGKIKLVFRDFPLNFHENAQKAAEASECADEQGKFWEYHDILFENQEALGVDSLKKYAADLSLDTEKFNSCLDSGKMASEVRKDLQDGQKAGIQGTPAFIINGKIISGAQPYKNFEAVINQELSK